MQSWQKAKGGIETGFRNKYFHDKQLSEKLYPVRKTFTVSIPLSRAGDLELAVQ